MKQTRIFSDQYIVITGAAGFIGSAVVRYLNDQGIDNLVLVDRLTTTDKWKNLVGKRFSRLISPEDLFAFLDGREREIEAFIHLGACTDTLEKDADYMLRENYYFSLRLVEYALKNEHRFIYASSAATYGDAAHGFSDDEEKLRLLKPLNIYAFSKHLFDLWLLREGVLDKVVGLKYFNVFGPNEFHKGHMASLIYKMFPTVQQGGSVELFKSAHPGGRDGEQKRDFLYVKDAAKMTCQLLQDAFKDVSGIFNLGSGEASSWNQLVSYLFQALGKPEKIRYIDMPEALKKQYQDYTCADMSKYQRVHGFKGTKPDVMPLKEAVADYVQNFLVPDKRW